MDDYTTVIMVRSLGCLAMALGATAVGLLTWEWWCGLFVGLWRRVRHPHPAPGAAAILEVQLVVTDARYMVLCRMYGTATYWWPPRGHRYHGTRCLDVGYMCGRVLSDGVVASVGLHTMDHAFVGPLEGAPVSCVVGRGAREGTYIQARPGVVLPTHLRGQTVAL